MKIKSTSGNIAVLALAVVTAIMALAGTGYLLATKQMQYGTSQTLGTSINNVDVRTRVKKTVTKVESVADLDGILAELNAPLTVDPNVTE